jgi:hypothetical protein
MQLSQSTLNRTTLQRQLLLERADLTALEAVERLVAVQGQEANPPYVGLWSRLRDLLAERWPGVEPLALAVSAQMLVPIVHAPPNGTWNQGGATPFTLAEEWLGHALEADPPLERLVTRYLAAFGPASVMDVQAWSGLTRLKAVAERMDLRTYRDESGRVLYDLPDAPLVPADTPAPVRFLPWFDNLIVGYADRGRMLTDERRARVCVGAAVYPTFLVDGAVAGMWDIADDSLVMRPFAPLPDSTRAELEEEGARLLAFCGLPAARVRWP